MYDDDSRALEGPDRRRSTDNQLIADGGQPLIYDVVELPDDEQGAPCPMYTGEDPTRCEQPSTHVFVYNTHVDGDGRRENVRCCPDCVPRVTADTDERADVRADGGTAWNDLTAFQQNLLFALAECEYEENVHGEVHGLALRDRLGDEDYYGEEINHGRLYPNLDELVEAGFIAKGEIDRRMNSYELTNAGENLIREHARHAIDILRDLNGDMDWTRARADGGEYRCPSAKGPGATCTATCSPVATPRAT